MHPIFTVHSHKMTERIAGLAKRITPFFLALCLALPGKAQEAEADLDNGKAIFELNCTSCHQLGSVLVGPNLVGVKKRWNGDLKRMGEFIHNPTALNGKDPYVTSLFQQYAPSIMNAFPTLKDNDIRDVVEYVDGGGMKEEPLAAGAAAPGGNFAPIEKDGGSLRWLFYLVIALLAITVIISLRVFRKVLGTAKAKKSDDLYVPRSDRRLQWVNAILFPVFLIVGFYAMYYEITIHWGKQLDHPASDVGAEIKNLFDITMMITFPVFIVTFIALCLFAWQYRHREGKKAYFYPHNNMLEFVWTIIPAIVLTALVTYGFRTWNKATGNPDNNPEMIELFAYQFGWEFRYPGADGVFGKTDFRMIDPGTNPLGVDFNDPASHDDFNTKELHLPKGKNVYLKLRSRDVLHAAYLPHFGMQMYVQPGMDNRIRFTPLFTTGEMREQLNEPDFDYELACNQLCGSAHYNMRRVVVVDDVLTYSNWKKAQAVMYTGGGAKPAEVDTTQGHIVGASAMKSSQR